MLVHGKHYRTVWWEDSQVRMIDQQKLPHEFSIVSFSEYEDVALAIKDMVVRGAGAIGATGGFGVALAAQNAPDHGFWEKMMRSAEVLRKTRPTAQNLFFAIDRVMGLIEEHSDEPRLARRVALVEAQRIADEDAAMCRVIGEHGAALIKDGMRINTHCNAGWLAFVDNGSALSPVYEAKRQGKDIFVWVDETRPRCQGKLTAWELAHEGVSHAIIADNAAGHYMRQGEIDMVIVGADRIAANGDVANKIGTYSSAVVAKENGIPFYVAAPLSTFDLGCKSGSEIPIEERCDDEVLYAAGTDEKGALSRIRIAALPTKARNPAFDVTPARYITGIITPKGIVTADQKSIASLFK